MLLLIPPDLQHQRSRTEVQSETGPIGQKAKRGEALLSRVREPS